MRTDNILSSILKQSHSVTSHSLKPGQLVYGKITKLFPNQMAAVQIGSTRLTAVVQASLQAGGQYWFRVESGQGQIALKIVDPSFIKDGSQAPQQLLSLLSIPQERESMELADFSLKNGIPASKESFETILSWLKEAPETASRMETVKTLYNQNLPVTKENLAALQSLDSGRSVYALLDSLSKHLTQMEHLPSAAGLKVQISALQIGADHTGERAISALVENWLKEEGKDGLAFKALKSLGLAKGLPEGENAALLEAVSQTANKEEASVKPFIKEVLSVLPNALKDSGGTIDAHINGEQRKLVKGMLMELMNDNRAGSENGVFSLSEAGKEMLKKLGLNLDRAMQILENPDILQGAGNLSQDKAGGNENEELSAQLRQLGAAHSVKPKELKEFFKQIAAAFGLEQAGEEWTADSPEKSVKTLKHALEAFIKESDKSPVREQAQELLNKLAAQQLLSQESGPLQNLFIQVPLKQADLTLHFSGKKKGDGSVDSDYCRVLFYLQLDSLKDVTIDMQVQNRIVSLTVYNENASLVKLLADKWLPKLKENFKAVNFTLSSFHISGGNADQGLKSSSNYIKQTIPYTGVDLRI
ncbi:hypothetical protein [Peribacillus kribbensis]|uniref:hypothetical protein n=1 Tax=Peribacillus kribbensis TaxID=356658 RepID=UPI00040EC37A|nr:hypothetical protein [Peribacillus kribbensis]